MTITDVGEEEIGKPKGVKRRTYRVVVPMLALLCISALPSTALDTRAIAAALRDPMSLFASRSPGEREAGALTQTKPGRGRSLVSRVPGGPRERVLSTVRTRPPVPGDVGDAGTPGADIPDSVADDGTPFAGTGPGGPSSDGPEIGGGGAPFFTTPQTIGPGIGNPGNGDETVVPPTSPVPEPQTWLMMMFGTLLVGGALRRRRAAEARIDVARTDVASDVVPQT